MDKKNEIVEHGISQITVQTAQFVNRTFTPAAMRAKWFRDELEQLWVKFDLAPEGEQQNVVTLVIPASRVVEVRYNKR